MERPTAKFDSLTYHRPRVRAKSLTKTTVVAGVFILGVLALALVMVLTALSRGDDNLYLAVVGPTSGVEKSDGAAMVDGIQMYLDEINQQGGVNGRKVKLLVLDDHNQPDEAWQRSLEIAGQKKALVVLGHYYSTTSSRAGMIYEGAGIPAITASATADEVTQGNPWYFRTVFNNGSQAVFLANYVKRVMGEGKATIIYDEDSFGLSLMEPFENTFRGLGGQVVHKWSIDSVADDLDEALAGILYEMEEADDLGVVFLALHGTEAATTIQAMKDRDLAVPIVGPDGLGDKQFAEKFKDLPKEQSQPGYYTNGTLATSHIIFDVANEAAQEFREGFIKKNGYEPSWVSATYYDAALLAVNALEATGAQGQPENLADEREKIRDYLAALDSQEEAVEGITGRMYFDRNRNAVKPVAVGVFDAGDFISAPIQLQFVKDVSQIPDLGQALDSGQVIAVDGKYMHQTSVVYTGIDFLHVSDIDTKSSSYNLDFVLSFRYPDELDVQDITFLNATTHIDLGQPVESGDTGLMRDDAYRVDGRFHGEFLFHDVPFDQQDLTVSFRHARLTRDNLIYVVGATGSATELEASSDLDGQLPVAGWKPLGVSLFQDTIAINGSLGNPLTLRSPLDTEYSRFNGTIKMRRAVMNLGNVNVLILIALVILSYLILFLPFRKGTVLIMSGLLLMTAFFHLRMSAELPGIGYLVALDWIFYVFYALIVFEILVAVIVQIADSRNQPETVSQVTLIARLVYPAVIVITLALLFNRYAPVQGPALLGQVGSHETGVSSHLKNGDLMEQDVTPASQDVLAAHLEHLPGLDTHLRLAGRP